MTACNSSDILYLQRAWRFFISMTREEYEEVKKEISTGDVLEKLKKLGMYIEDDDFLNFFSEDFRQFKESKNV